MHSGWCHLWAGGPGLSEVAEQAWDKPVSSVPQWSQLQFLTGGSPLVSLDEGL